MLSGDVWRDPYESQKECTVIYTLELILPSFRPFMFLSAATAVKSTCRRPALSRYCHSQACVFRVGHPEFISQGNAPF